MTNYIGIDVGTTAFKALLVNDAQQVLARAEANYPTHRPRPLWSEQDPDDWWRATGRVMAELRAAAPGAFGAVRGLGLSGQMHGAVVLDGDGAVLRPAMLWNDGRADAECALLEAAVPGLGDLAGVPAMPGFTAPKLLWLRRHEPELFGRIRHVVPPKDYLRMRLSGECLTDCSDAAGTLWLDQARRCWAEPMITACGLSEGQLPELVEGSEPAGVLRSSLAAEWGLPDGVVIAGGAGDVAAGAVGIGAVEDGDAFLSLGTSCQYFVTTGDYRPYPQATLHAFAHTLPERWFQMAAMLNGASALAWAAGLVGQPIAPLLERVEAAYRGPGRVIFLPYLSGERTPHNDPLARGVFFGLDAGTTTEDLVQAVLEGVAFSLAEAQDCLAAAGTRVEGLAAIGGGARSAFWMRLLAAVLDRPVTLYRGGEHGPAYGAARLARLAVTGEQPGAVCTRPEIERIIEPDPRTVEAYSAPSARFRRLYRVLREEFRHQ